MPRALCYVLAFWLQVFFIPDKHVFAVTMPTALSAGLAVWLL
jgi:hypothetical protein